MTPDKFIERRIITGMVVSTEYLIELEPIYVSSFLTSASARMIANWVWEYFSQYRKAPGRDMEGIYAAQLQKGTVSEEQAENIEDVLESLAGEYGHSEFNVEYLLDQTKEYFKTQKLRQFSDRIKAEVDGGDITNAENLALSYHPISTDDSIHIIQDPFTDLKEIKNAFTKQTKPLINFGGALDLFWGKQFTRDAFISLMAPEKRGKTFMLLEIAMKAMISGCHVAFFQAGDMSKGQQMRRMCVYVSKVSDDEDYCDEMYAPIVDCWLNQTNQCDLPERECDFGIFEDRTPDTITMEELIEAYQKYPDYKPCKNCQKKGKNSQMVGTPWIEKIEEKTPLDWTEAYKNMKRFRKRNTKEFKLITYPNETLTIQEIKGTLETLERKHNFVPDVIVIDYADILAPDPDIRKMDWRNSQNKIWQRLRSMSQERHCLVVTATQAAASSYDRSTLQLSDFSEDKRKYAHITAMYALNQTDEEKKIGVIRIGEMMVREGAFDRTRQVKVLQRLQQGRPHIGSYF